MPRCRCCAIGEAAAEQAHTGSLAGVNRIKRRLSCALGSAGLAALLSPAAPAEQAVPNPHQIEIELSLPDSASARRIEAELRNQGNQVGATAETMSTRHFLALSRAVNLNDGALGALQRQLCALAEAIGGECDHRRVTTPAP